MKKITGINLIITAIGLVFIVFFIENKDEVQLYLENILIVVCAIIVATKGFELIFNK